MKYLWSITLLVFLTGSLSAQGTQPKEKHPYLGLNIGLAFLKSKDELVMPVRYSGTNFKFGLSYWKDNPKSLQRVNIESIIGTITTREVNLDNFGARYKEPRSQIYWAEIGYQYLYKLDFITSENYNFLMGVNPYLFFNVRFNERWDNSAINYEGAITPLSWTGKVERQFTTKKDKNLILSYSLNFPLLTFVVRPDYSGVPDFLDHETPFVEDMFQRGEWTSFWGFPRIKSNLELAMHIAEKNQLKFSYKWEYYSYQDPLKTQFAGHSINITLLTHL